VTATRTGPLRGCKVVELAGIGPAPFCGLVLSDLGADVVRIDRVDAVRRDGPAGSNANVLDRGRRSVGVDLKSAAGVDLVLELVAGADALVEGFRPGVTERLGLGPDTCLERNPALVYGRMTGWGQEGPLADRAGHDIDYIAIAGALGAFGRAGGPPVAPLNLVGDFGGGGLLLALGIVAGILEVARGGAGQVVDAAMVDGAALLMAPFYAAAQGGWWGPRGTNYLDSGVPFYDCYECADGGWVAVGALEPQFYAELLDGLGLDPGATPDRDDAANHGALRALFASTFATRSRDEWTAAFAGRDACVAPVLGLTEAPADPHLVARRTFTELDGVVHPSPAPRFSATPAAIAGAPCRPGQHTRAALADWGIAADRLDALEAEGTIASVTG
jgi:alpha-methylacyl-CoA racemase